MAASTCRPCRDDVARSGGLIALVLAALIAGTGSSAGEIPEVGLSPYVPLQDEAYDIVERWVTAGVLDRSEAVDRPISQQRMKALLAQATRYEVNRLGGSHRSSGRAFAIPYCTVSAHWVQSSRDRRPNLDPYVRIDFSKGTNLVLEISSAVSVIDRVLLYASPYGRYTEDGVRGRLRRAYVALRVFGTRIDIGRDTQWFGPGYHGDFVLTDNAPPFDMVRIRRRLGALNGTLVVGQVYGEMDTRIGHPPRDVGFGALRGAWTYADRIVLEGELGATVPPGENPLLGLKPQKGFDEAGGVNQVAEVGVTYYPTPGMKLYAASAGDDFWNVGWAKRMISWGRKSASMIGIYLVPSWGRGLDFRAEYAVLREEVRDDWYRHRNAYFHRQWVLGHHNGRNEDGQRTEERDLFFRTTFLNSGISFLALSYDRESSRFVKPASADDVVHAVSFEMVRSLWTRWKLRFEGWLSMQSTTYHDSEVRSRRRWDGRSTLALEYRAL